jgi:hypothetical protein
MGIVCRVLASPIAGATGWPAAWIIGALSLGRSSGLASPRVGRLIERFGGRPVHRQRAVLLAIGLLIRRRPRTSRCSSSPGWRPIPAWGRDLYDPAFHLGPPLWRHAAADPHLTLFGGCQHGVLAPSALFVEQFGWRGARLAARSTSPWCRSTCSAFRAGTFGVPPASPRTRRNRAGRRRASDGIRLSSWPSD